jgi:WD40 repeat protein
MKTIYAVAALASLALFSQERTCFAQAPAPAAASPSSAGPEPKLIAGSERRFQAVAASRDGAQLAWFENGTLSVYSVAEGKVTATLKTDVSDVDDRALEFSPDGTQLAFRSGNYGHAAWKLYSAANLELKLSWKPDTTENLFDARFAPDGKSVYFFVGADDLEVRSLAAIDRPGIKVPMKGILYGHFLGPDRLAVWGEQELAVYNKAGARMQSWNPGREVARTVYSPDGRLAATYAGSDKRVAVWDTTTAELITEVISGERGTSCAAFSADGQSLLVAEPDRPMKIWSPRTGELRSVWSPDKSGASGIVTVPESSLFYTYAGDGFGNPARLTQWDLTRVIEANPPPLPGTAPAGPFTFGQPAALFAGGGKSIGFLDGGKQVYSVNPFGDLEIHDLATKRVVREMSLGEVNHLAFSPDGNWMALAYGGVKGPNRYGSFTIPREQRDPSYQPPKLPPGRVEIRNAKTGLPHKTLTLETSTPLALAFSPDSRTLAVASGNSGGPRQTYVRVDVGMVNVYTKGRGEPKPEPPPETATGPDADSELSLWDVAAGTRIERLPVGRLGFRDVQFDPTGDLLAMLAGDGHLTVWDRKTNGQRFRLKFDYAVRDFQFSPNGRFLVTGGGSSGGKREGKIELIDTATGARTPGPADERFITAVAFSPDASLLVAGSTPGRDTDALRIWSLPEFKEVRRVSGLSGVGVPGTLARFSPDGSHLVEGLSGATSVWRLDHLFDVQLQRDIQTMVDRKVGVEYRNGILHFQYPHGQATDRDLKSLPAFTHPFVLELRSSEAVTDAGLIPLLQQKNLVGLSIDSCDKITPVGLATLKRLPFTYLYLSSPGFEGDQGMLAIGQFPKLETLHLSVEAANNPQALAPLKPMKSLRELVFEEAEFPGVALEALGLLPKLEVLHLNYCHVTDDDFRHLARLVKLRELRIDSDNFVGLGLKLLNRALDLEVLDLSDSGKLDDFGFSNLPKLRKLREVDLSSTQVKGRGLLALSLSSGIEKLSLADGITDEGLVAIGKFPLLHDLNLNRSTATDRGLMQLAGLKQLEKLHLSGAANFTGAGLAALAEAAMLAELDLHECPGITDAGLKGVAGLKQLQSLILPPQVSDAALDHVAQLPELRKLVLENTRVTDAGIAKLAALEHLSELKLTGTGVTDAVATALLNIKNLYAIGLRGTRVTAAGKDALTKGAGQSRSFYIDGP